MAKEILVVKWIIFLCLCVLAIVSTFVNKKENPEANRDGIVYAILALILRPW
jgi:hypothetical protein